MPFGFAEKAAPRGNELFLQSRFWSHRQEDFWMSKRQTAKVGHYMGQVCSRCIIVLLFLSSAHSGVGQSKASGGDGQIVRKVIISRGAGRNLLRADTWRPL